ncbi:hypothetical protein [Aneurinibacillus tyrosinisolvens]|uniref:hypothetical protein n=1 Tax=Aneurinibacillus tyrosinisolvens TaxID=1443435 RepID=UPI00063EF146|nr:hypothetical protein [Aneurinibacillus tyrosinisolvens]
MTVLTNDAIYRFAFILCRSDKELCESYKAFMRNILDECENELDLRCEIYRLDNAFEEIKRKRIANKNDGVQAAPQ